MNKPRTKRLGDLQGDHRSARCAGPSYFRWQPKIVRLLKRQAGKAERQDGKRSTTNPE